MEPQNENGENAEVPGLEIVAVSARVQEGLCVTCIHLPLTPAIVAISATQFWYHTVYTWPLYFPLYSVISPYAWTGLKHHPGGRPAQCTTQSLLQAAETLRLNMAHASPKNRQCRPRRSVLPDPAPCKFSSHVVLTFWPG